MTERERTGKEIKRNRYGEKHSRKGKLTMKKTEMGKRDMNRKS